MRRQSLSLSMCWLDSFAIRFVSMKTPGVSKAFRIFLYRVIKIFAQLSKCIHTIYIIWGYSTIINSTMRRDQSERFSDLAFVTTPRMRFCNRFVVTHTSRQLQLEWGNRGFNIRKSYSKITASNTDCLINSCLASMVVNHFRLNEYQNHHPPEALTFAFDVIRHLHCGRRPLPGLACLRNSRETEKERRRKGEIRAAAGFMFYRLKQTGSKPHQHQHHVKGMWAWGLIK